MLFPGLDLDYIGQQFQSTAPAVVAASSHSAPEADDADHSPAMLEKAMLRLLELLAIIEAKGSMSVDLSHHDVDLNELGDYAIHILSDLSAVAGSLNLSSQSQSLEDLTLPMALWIARHQGELRTLEPIVNALARQANTLREPSALAQLYQVAAELQHAASPLLHQDLEKQNPARPWRLLLMNQAIIATRSHQSELIEEAYQLLIEALPEEAQRFFEEGMQQMEALNYPDVVRQLVEKYYNLWNTPKTLH
ncbi:MAG: hypothetical protein KZQ93_04910 [Candidatus Thiodiazotropha sp. (ex Monitilora ramsayi)]|nr:hypothetical protein [Candidatus Thiodiazotropha sp. (ex Monitilora ramsayi)]